MTGGQAHINAGTFSAMLSGIPEVAEQQTKGKPPVGSARTVFHREFQRRKFKFCRLNAVAFAYAHVTRRGHSGQCPAQPGFSSEAQKTESERVGGSQ